jgi:hypothetical protein
MVTYLALNMISIFGFCIKGRSMAKKAIFDGFNGQFEQIRYGNSGKKRGTLFNIFIYQHGAMILVGNNKIILHKVLIII